MFAKFIRFVVKLTLYFSAIILLIGISLFFFDFHVPKFLLSKLSSAISNENCIVNCESMSLGFRNGVRIKNACIYDLSRKDAMKPMASVELLEIDCLKRSLRAIRLKFERLGDSYYLPGYSEMQNGGLYVELPVLPEFSLELIEPNILGIAPKRLLGKMVMERSCCEIGAIRIDWPDHEDVPMSIDGTLRLDLATQTVQAKINGTALQKHIRPLLATLDLTSALPYMDAFTGIDKPIPSVATFDVDLIKGDFHMNLNLKPTMGYYNGVRMSYADGTIDVLTQIRGTNCNVRLGVDLPRAIDINGYQMNGKINLNMHEGLIRLQYDAQSELDFTNILQVADFIDPKVLSDIVCKKPPKITLRGQTGVTAADKEANELYGTAACADAEMLGVEMMNFKSDYKLKSDILSFENASAQTKSGGSLSGNLDFYLEDFEMTNAHFAVNIQCKGAPLSDFATFLRRDFGSLECKVDDMRINVQGPVATNYINRISGSGYFYLSSGNFMEMRCLKWLSENIMQKLLNIDTSLVIAALTSARASFTVKEGLLRSDDIVLDGKTIQIAASGTYDISSDWMDFKVSVSFLKEGSFLGKIINGLTFPIRKLLNFHVTGPSSNPKWEYDSL